MFSLSLFGGVLCCSLSLSLCGGGGVVSMVFVQTSLQSQLQHLSLSCHLTFHCHHHPCLLSLLVYVCMYCIYVCCLCVCIHAHHSVGFSLLLRFCVIRSFQRGFQYAPFPRWGHYLCHNRNGHFGSFQFHLKDFPVPSKVTCPFQ